jgi:ABC-2 type transport system ATP-binding protein
MKGEGEEGVIMGEYVIETQGLTKKYTRHKEAVKSLALQVPKGSVYVFLGRNGAGKTTTIRLLMGLLQKTSGKAEVLGMDPDKQPVPIKKRVGYVADNQKMYDWMTVEETINFCSPFYPTWNNSLSDDLLRRFELSKKAKVKDLSRGMNGKLALLLALSHQPELLILDDPTSGLDAVVRREFLQGIIEVIHQEAKTVFFSTHIITEAEQIADYVGILEEGKLLLSQPLNTLKDSVKLIRLIFEEQIPERVSFPELIKKETLGHELILTVKDYTPELSKRLAEFNPKSINVVDLPLEDIFVSLVGREGT